MRFHSSPCCCFGSSCTSGEPNLSMLMPSIGAKLEGSVPIHVVARVGHLAVVKTFVASVSYISARILSEEEMKRFNIYVLKDTDGNTPLHVALNERYMETALCLLNANNHESFLENNDGISSLYMAVKAGDLAIMKAILNGLGNNVQGQVSNLASKLEGRKSLVHAALKTQDRDPTFGDERDEEGRTCLSFGASIWFYKRVCNLIDRSMSDIFECNNGSFPIHKAIEKGYVDVVKEIIKCCPNSKELLNKPGHNILHIAAKSGKAGFLLRKYIKRLDRNKHHLIEEGDADGNTPMHLEI